jgi:sigma-B regulation protein RsbQ
MTVAAEPGVLLRNHVVESGDPDGRPLVFLHGFGCSQETWRLVTPHLARDHRIVLLDHVGSGASDWSAYDFGRYDSLHGYADDVLDVLEALDLHDAVLVAHSVSAMIAVLATNQGSTRIGALVLVGPSPRYLDAEGYEGGFTESDIDAMLDSLDANYFGWSSAIAPVIMGNGDRPELAAELGASFCRCDPSIASHFARVTFLSDNRRDLPLVTLPTLVLQASDDVLAPLAVGRYVHESIPGSTFVVMAATGHLPNLSAPEEVATHVRSFLANGRA